jgi:hypothetical protein
MGVYVSVRKDSIAASTSQDIVVVLGDHPGRELYRQMFDTVFFIMKWTIDLQGNDG